ncbi:MAG: monofunctional biosynthetic peptidoglycan transglycosylase [Bacteroidaceae bacterium]|nr:monofunctional biosynthetic peptidoglycan transglycosylase [Bacteroidaceae bacterium]
MKKVFSFILKTAITFIVLSIIWVVVYRFVPIPGTLLMLSRNINDNAPIHYDWQPLENITPHLALAVVSSEDNLFTQHNGFDIDAIKLAQEEAKKGKKLRGASTISQQTAKNVFLWNGRSWVRKGLEAYFTVLIELIWGKERIMEVYLNCIEMGNGIYGASAVAKHHFGTSADKLTKSQCALIAATLPNPRKYNSAKPSKYMLKRQSDILKLMKYIGKVDYNNTTDKKKSK